MIARDLFPLNCRHNFIIAEDGKCYSEKCMLNSDDILKDKIKKNGCKCFNAPEVQALLDKK